MAEFTSLEGLEKYLNSSAGQSTMTTSGITIKEMMVKEAEEIKGLIQKYMDEYFNKTKTSGIYPRTGGLQNSMIVDDIAQVEIIGNTAIVHINFDEDSLTTQTIWDGTATDYSRLELMDQGWEVGENVWFHDIPNFGKFEGIHFLKKAIDEYNSKNPYGLDVKVEGLSYDV